ncbi:MAG: ABC transporter permease, partial [Nevskiales bacterium]
MTEWALSWRHALRRLRRATKAGELRILALAIVVAVAAASVVGLFSERMRAALAAQSGDTLGGDVIVTGREPIPESLAPAAREAGLRISAFVSFPSLLIAGERSALASVKAVEANFPLHGEMRIADEPYGAARRAEQVPPPGEAWADVRLWSELGLKPGMEVQVGASTLKVRAVLENEPGRGMGFFDLAPRLLINTGDVAATGLMGPGSRVQYGLLLAGDSAALER